MSAGVEESSCGCRRVLFRSSHGFNFLEVFGLQVMVSWGNRLMAIKKKIPTGDHRFWEHISFSKPRRFGTFLSCHLWVMVCRWLVCELFEKPLKEVSEVSLLAEASGPDLLELWRKNNYRCIESQNKKPSLILKALQHHCQPKHVQTTKDSLQTTENNHQHP